MPAKPKMAVQVSCIMSSVLSSRFIIVALCLNINLNKLTHQGIMYNVSCVILWTLSRWVGQYVSIYKNDHTHPPRYHVSCIISSIVTLLRTLSGWVGKCLHVIKNHHTHPSRYHVSCLIFWIYHGLFRGG